MMSGDTCIMPDGNCSGCDHCGQDEAICTASPAFRDQCDNNCTGCEHCDEGEAFCDLDTVDDGEPCTSEIPCVFCEFIASEGFRLFPGLVGECKTKVREEMRRYLYRNVACEARKLSDIARHIPDVRGWA